MKLTIFKEIDFLNAVKALFHELKVPVNYVADEPTTVKEILKDTYKNNSTFALVDDAYFVGMVDDAAFSGNQSLTVDKIKSDYDGILIFGITLHQRENNLLPTRSQLAEISRAFNREFYYTPVVLVFKYRDNISEYLAFANTERLKYKQEWREGEKAGKVSLLRDINIKKPHRGHEDIINQLRIPTSGTKQVDSFAKLYNYWQEVFSVSILNKKFYKELQNWYFWAIQEVAYPNSPNRFDFDSDEKFDEAIKEHKGKNVIRLLTRILFIWFIKEKRLIPEEIFDEETITDRLIEDFTPQKPHGVFATGKQNSKYYRAILQNLFFATLNQEMGKRFFRNDKQHQNVTNLMRYKSYFKDSEYFVQLMEDIVPFMNGGLFECLDKPHETIKGKQGGDKIIYIDGFSDRPDNSLVVPDYLFFDVDEDVDLSDDFGSKSKVYKNAKTRGLLEILKSYKFTITENTPIEEDVALDPELLGKVFENLLASYNPETKTTARKQTGSFYTPREIVNYMVDESLITYLKNAITDWNLTEEELDKNLHQLFSFDEINPFENSTELQKQIIKALDKAKILDPAAGSGAFPMGVLQKMVHVLHKVDPQSTEWKQRQIDKVNTAIESLEEIDDAKFREQSIKELKAQIKDIEDAFENNELDYGRKLFLIENCIYGVDIQSIATQISKLRFFISLIVDQKIDKSKDNFGIRPLPNLETKFVAANTLVGIDKPDAQLSLFDKTEVEKLEKQLKKVRHKIFSSKSPKRKRELRQEDKKLREKIAELLEEGGMENKTARQLASWDPYNQNASSSFFDPEWMFDIKEGFDVVIGNPPFISYYARRSAKLSTHMLRYYQRNYDFITDYKLDGKFNSIMFFIEKGVKLSKTNGSTFFIVDVAFNDVPYRYIRKYILDQTRLDKVIKGLSAFENVYSDQLLIEFNKKSNPLLQIDYTVEIGHSLSSVENQQVKVSVFEKSKNNEFYIPEDESVQQIFELIEIHPILKDLFPKKLIRTCFSLAGHEDEFLLRNNPNKDNQPVLKYIQNAKNFPFKYSQLRQTEEIVYDESLKDELNQFYRKDAYNEQRRQPKALGLGNLFAYQHPKLFVRQSAIEIIATYEKYPCAANTSFYIVSDIDEYGYKSKISLKYLLAILNSKLATYYALKKNIIRTGGKKQPQMMIKPFKSLHIPIPQRKSEDILKLLVNFILFNANNDIYGPITDVVNALVFNLYFPIHMKERGIDVLQFVDSDTEEVMQGRDFENLSNPEKEEVIEQLHKIWTNPDNEVRNRIKLFAIRSPEILKPILES